jgi:valyl-tRNA synthetase
VKYRLYEGKDASAQWTLCTVLNTLLKLFAPILPHVTEELYQKLLKQYDGAESIHASAWPVADNSLLDEKMEKSGDLAVSIISAIRAWKHENKMALNTPLKNVKIEAGSDEKKLLELFLPDITGTLKAGKIEFAKADQQIAGTELKFSVSI